MKNFISYISNLNEAGEQVTDKKELLLVSEEIEKIFNRYGALEYDNDGVRPFVTKMFSLKIKRPRNIKFGISLNVFKTGEGEYSAKIVFFSIGDKNGDYSMFNSTDDLVAFTNIIKRIEVSLEHIEI